MIKRGLSYLFLAVISVGFISAQYYGNFSLGNILNSVDASTMVLGIIFVVSALLINAALGRSHLFKESKSVAGVISIFLALGIIWAVNRSGWDYYYFFNGVFFFIPAGFLETMWPIGLLVLVVLIAIKWKWESLYFIGGLLILAGWAVGNATIWVLGAAVALSRIIYVKFIKKKPQTIRLETR